MKSDTIIKIRPIHKDDKEAVLAVYKSGWLETYPNKDNDISLKSVQKVVDGFVTTSIHKNKYVAEISGRVCGVISIKEGDVCTIQALYVSKQYQGRGVGTKLLNFVFNKYGPVTYELKVAQYNHKAIEFYKKFGFGIVPDSLSFEKVNDLEIPQLTMCRCVTARSPQ